MRSIIGVASIRGGCVASWLSEIASNPLKPRIFFSRSSPSSPPPPSLPPIPCPPPLVSPAPLTANNQPHGGAGEARFLALPKTACGRDGASTCVGTRHVKRKWGYSTWRLYTHRAQQCTNARAASTPVWTIRHFLISYRAHDSLPSTLLLLILVCVPFFFSSPITSVSFSFFFLLVVLLFCLQSRDTLLLLTFLC